MELVGRTLGKYRIEELIGRGSMSVCYRAVNTVLGTTVALKVLSPEYRNEPLVVTAFQEKAHYGALVSHPTIINVHDLVMEGENLFVVTEFVDGPKLSDIVRERGPLEAREGLRILSQVAEGLACAHEVGAVHRNITPHNIKIRNDGTPVVIDFGLAIVMRDFFPSRGDTEGRLRYRSPEELREEDVDYRTDLWGLGVTAYLVFTGKHPFPGESSETIRAQILAGRISATPSQLQSSLPRDIDGLVVRLLASDPKDRFDSARQVQEELRHLLEILSGPDDDTVTMGAPAFSRLKFGPLSTVRHRDFGPYRLLELKGAGSFAMVYMAEDRRSGRLVALKHLKPEYADSEDIIERFRREAQIAQRIEHPNVVRFYEFGVEERDDGHTDIYFTMEYIEGPRLKDLIPTSRPMRLSRVLDIAAQIAQGLHAAHEVGIIHRDLKPANILLDKKGKALIADFGIAVAHFVEERLTNPGQLMGTYAYMSPEQASGEEVVPASDLYSLGVILYEMLVGEIPIKDGPPLLMLRSIMEDEPAPFPASLEVPPALQELALRLLRKAPSERAQSAAEVAETLGRMREELAAPALA